MKKILAVVLDGWGMREEVHGNAIKQAVLPNFTKMWNEYPHSLLSASGAAVGLPDGQFGNSEVGHLALGAGRLIKQKEVVIDEMFQNNDLDKNEYFNETIEYAKTNNKPIHMMALCSDGGVHALVRHFIKMLEELKKREVKEVYFHLITDGRDTDSHSSYKYIKEVEDAAKKLGIGAVATISGRYDIMDRDNKWDRIKKAYDVITRGAGNRTLDIKMYIDTCYSKGVTDEFIPPVLVNEKGIIKNGDVLLWMNYRPDRARQILQTLTDPNFNSFQHYKMPDLKVITLYPVKDVENIHPLLENTVVNNSFGVYISNLGLTQARIAETEKFAHVTNFFDGEFKGKIDNCDRFLIPSPLVDTYDMKPEMSAIDVCKKTINCMDKDYDFILVNFANPDMVGHTGNMEAAIKAVQVVDLCLGKLKEVADDNFYTMFVLADHGNADIMLDEKNNPVTTHTTSLVPFIVTDKKIKVENGHITQFAPTILEYMDIAIPKEMKGTKSLIEKQAEEQI